MLPVRGQQIVGQQPSTNSAWLQVGATSTVRSTAADLADERRGQDRREIKDKNKRGSIHPHSPFLHP
jgi:hypothetical protein